MTDKYFPNGKIRDADSVGNRRRKIGLSWALQLDWWKGNDPIFFRTQVGFDKSLVQWNFQKLIAKIIFCTRNNCCLPAWVVFCNPPMFSHFCSSPLLDPWFPEWKFHSLGSVWWRGKVGPSFLFLHSMAMLYYPFIIFHLRNVHQWPKKQELQGKLKTKVLYFHSVVVQPSKKNMSLLSLWNIPNTGNILWM